MGESLALNGPQIWPAFSPGRLSGATGIVSMSLIICIDDPGAGFSDKPGRPAAGRGRGGRSRPCARDPAGALISGSRARPPPWPIATPADRGSVATERRSGPRGPPQPPGPARPSSRLSQIALTAGDSVETSTPGRSNGS